MATTQQPTLDQAVTAVKKCFSKYADFTGRASRPEYWWFYLLGVIVGFGTQIGQIFARGGTFGEITGYIMIFACGLASLAMFIPSLAVLWRRLHDTGRSGWWFFICLIPIVGAIWLIVLLCQPSQPGENEYGMPDPID